jgi:transcriptional regulator with XRE-family HTH domain
MVGDRLKGLRQQLGLSQEALARLVGVSFPTINRWESSDRVSGPHGTILVLLLALEAAARVEPRLGRLLAEWAPMGQAYVLHSILSITQAARTEMGSVRPRRSSGGKR